MALNKTTQIDVTSIRKTTDEVVLTLIDEAEWANENDHLLLLQEKLNSYLAFIENGEIYQSYPAAFGRRLVIEIIFQFYPTSGANDFLKKCFDVMREIDVQLKWNVFRSSGK